MASQVVHNAFRPALRVYIMEHILELSKDVEGFGADGDSFGEGFGQGGVPDKFVIIHFVCVVPAAAYAAQVGS